ncbi:SDR family NAD(P)-dependent oxidoreductase [Microbulbifer hydrolyticus]|uniref:NAD(P)-dependent dehydrogenase (Short-subunit alcohol dehydrogenase family) n=1 Tax=Microbulbifer hydrolyticus TaxID=48074 RepID=A0A6P1TC93_9GAMM|nr:SDR family NAD(P)-dependent oxidoreductase [Microbulbifer hydrolyticus]MBB5210221.1 NAD(P)-dependent dehydrogenase (short-subunit alcohol dehydrogenase family) [Microbulbifer hydrolyticus]QHQ39273.1 SDR family NAD(P)-dependent oxidoreductase [Microbulbifer hydrolyticus]
MKDGNDLSRKKTIWVTGAGSGIGAALVRSLVADGHFVIVSGRSRDALLEVQKPAPKLVRVLSCDVGDDASMASAGAALREITDQLDMVIACAGVCEYDDNLSLDVDSYRRVFDANFFGVVNTLREALPLLANAREPVFAAVGSLSSVVGFPRAEAYGASKAALQYFMDAVRADTSRLPLRTVLIRPGFIETPLTRENDFNMPFLMSPEDAADRILAGLKTRKAVIDFPRRLSWPLRLLGMLRPVWFGWCAPRMTRIKKLRRAG